MEATVDALLPLSLLEAVRSSDTPEDTEGEYVAELRNKRLGLSDTVYAQIGRYHELVKKNRRLPLEDATGVATLVGRRPDAETVFRAAGRHLAGQVYGTVSPVRRVLLNHLPSFISRPIALGVARSLSRRYLNADVNRVGGFVILSVSDSATADAAPGAVGCTFYEAAFAELLMLVVNGGGAVEHVRCCGRGEGVCEWRAEWRSARKWS